jgi:hypothetical protein
VFATKFFPDFSGNDRTTGLTFSSALPGAKRRRIFTLAQLQHVFVTAPA